MVKKKKQSALIQKCRTKQGFNVTFISKQSSRQRSNVSQISSIFSCISLTRYRAKVSLISSSLHPRSQLKRSVGTSAKTRGRNNKGTKWPVLESPRRGVISYFDM